MFTLEVGRNFHVPFSPPCCFFHGSAGARKVGAMRGRTMVLRGAKSTPPSLFTLLVLDIATAFFPSQSHLPASPSNLVFVPPTLLPPTLRLLPYAWQFHLFSRHCKPIPGSAPFISFTPPLFSPSQNAPHRTRSPFCP